MADYDLTRLGTREFEHVVQALAKSVIASGVTPFGDGPDGAREATYEGLMSYPSKGEQWNGYLIIQSKFRQRPVASASANGTWFISQIEADLDKFLDSSRNLRAPDYYIATTNIHLTPTERTGTRDKVLATLAEYAPRIGLKGYDAWAFDDLCRLLDGNESIRRAYAHLVTPGDVIAALADTANSFSAIVRKPGLMRKLIERFREEEANNAAFSGIIPKLQHYSSIIDAPAEVQGIEGKLTDAGHENLVHLGISTKEQFAKKLTEFQFSRSAQEILSFLLAEVYTRFHTGVMPAISAGGSQAVVLGLVQTTIIDPVSELVEENVLDLYSDELAGMLYFLTGNCHIKWSA